MTVRYPARVPRISMATIVEQLPRGGRVLVIRLRSLGDCVLTTPAISLLHARRPDLVIGVMAEAAFRPVFEGNPAVGLLPEPSVADARAFGADLALNLHGLQASMELTVASGARWRAGFAHHRASSVYNVKIPSAQEIFGDERPVHTAEHLASAMFHLGVPRREVPRAQLFVPPPRESSPRGAAPFAVLHPFARTADMTWPADDYLAWRPWRTAHELLKGRSTCVSIPYGAVLDALGRLQARA